MSETKPTLFADGLLDAAVHHGVVRLTLGQLGQDGKPVACGQLVLPLTQLPVVANGVLALLRQIEAKAKEQQAQQVSALAGSVTAPPAAAAEPAAPEMPGTFSFGGR
jgi:hypothetical protein